MPNNESSSASAPGGRGVWGNASWLAGERIGQLALALATNMVLARKLGPAEFGTLAYATAFAALFVPMSSLGLERVFVRESIRRRAETGQLAGSALGMRLAGGIVGWLLAIAIAALQSEHSGLVAVVAAGNVFLAFDVADWCLQAREQMKIPAMVRLGAGIMGATARIVAALVGADLRVIGGLIAAQVALIAALQWWVWWRQRGNVRWIYSGALARELFALGLPVLGAEFAVMIFQRFDLVLLGWLASDAEVGQYSAAVRITQLWLIIPVVAGRALFPTLARAAGHGLLRQETQRAMNLLTWGGIAAGVLTSAIAPLAVRVIFGSKYDAAAGLLRITAWTTMFAYMGCVHSLFLVASNHQRITMRLAWLTAAASVGCNLWLVPRFHAEGAAIAGLLAIGVTTLLGVGCWRESRPLLAANFRAIAAPLLAGWNRLKRAPP